MKMVLFPVHCIIFFLFPEPTVRSDLVEQVPHVAMYCQEKSNLFANAVPTYILPLIVIYLSDNDNQVQSYINSTCLFFLPRCLKLNWLLSFFFVLDCLGKKDQSCCPCGTS